MSVSVKTYDYSIPAGGAVQIQAVGSYFRIQTTTGPVRVQGEFGDLASIGAGQGLKDSTFTRLAITNLSGVAITGTVIVADKEFVDQQMLMSGSINSNITNNLKLSANQFGVYADTKTFETFCTAPAIAGYGARLVCAKSTFTKSVYLRKLIVNPTVDTTLYSFAAASGNYAPANQLASFIRNNVFMVDGSSENKFYNPTAVSIADFPNPQMFTLGNIKANVDNVFDFTDRPVFLGGGATFLTAALNISAQFRAVWDET